MEEKKWNLMPSGTYRHEQNGIRATYGKYEHDKDPYFCANDCLDASSPFISGSACDLLTAKAHAESAIDELLELRKRSS